MALDHFMDHESGSAELFDAPPLCDYCNTADYLFVESIQPCSPRKSGWVSVEYSCGQCEEYFAYNATIQNVSLLLAESPQPSGVLHFGHQYIHCGEPMEVTTMRVYRLSTDDCVLAEVPAMKMPTAALRCRCGFQMAIPTA